MASYAVAAGALMDGPHYVIKVTSRWQSVLPGLFFHILKDRQRDLDAYSRPYVGVATWTQVQISPFERVLQGVNGHWGKRIRGLPESKENSWPH